MAEIITKVKGLHGLTLIRNPDSKGDFHFIEDIYQGEASINNPRAVNVPNVGDMVLDRSAGYMRWLEVIYVDEITLIATMTEADSKISNNTIDRNQALQTTGISHIQETFRLYLDTSVVPHVYAIDSRLYIYDNETTKYKIFLGRDTSKATGKVISMDFNANGELVSEDIPLEKVAFAATDKVDTNLAVKAPRRGYTSTAMDNGTLVTLVAYSDSGVATSYNNLLVHNTALDRTIEASQKYVTTISIESPFLDKTENNTLVFPMNTPRDALAIMGVVHYSDGTSKRLPIDGTRMRLEGLYDYVPFKKDQNINLVLIYNLPDGEMSLNSSTGSNRFIAVKYFGRTLQVDGSYSVNIFPIPSYVSDSYGWKMRYMLYTLDRDIAYDVTNLVTTSANSKTFEPLNYTDDQSITVSLDLSKVSPTLKKFIHLQTYSINLIASPGANQKTVWRITYEQGQKPTYGDNVLCKGTQDKAKGTWRLDISCGCESEKEWLEKVYYPIKPLINAYTETRAPKPTHFTLDINGTTVTYPLQSWNKVLHSRVGATDGFGVMLMWTRVEGNKQYQLGASPMSFVNLSEGGVSSHASTTVVDTSANTSTVIDIEAEVARIVARGASQAVVEKYRALLKIIKANGLLKYKDINDLYQRIRTTDITPAQIANDVILLEEAVNLVSIEGFNRQNISGVAPASMEENTTRNNPATGTGATTGTNTPISGDN